MIRNDINTAITNNNTTILNKVDKNIDVKINENNTTILNKVDKNIDVKSTKITNKSTTQSILRLVK